MKVGKKHLFARVVAVIVAFVLGLAIVQWSAYQISVEQKTQVERNLQEVVEQNVSKLESVLESRAMILAAMCVQMSDEEDPAFLIDQFAPLVDIYNLKRIGYVAPNGDSYTTDGFQANLAHRDFFQHSMKGETYLTDVLVDGIGMQHEDINVHSMPVYSVDGSRITGVMFVTYRTSDFINLLYVGAFGVEGTTCIVQQDGEIIGATANQELKAGENIFDSLIAAGDGNRAAVEELRGNMAAGKSTLSAFTLGGNQYFFYLTAIETKPDWFFTTIVPAHLLTQRSQPVLVNVRNMIAGVVVLLLLCVLVYLGTYHQQRQELFQLAYLDPLTELDNYTAFREKMRNGDGVSGAGYVVSVDLRGFGTINNTCGVSKGDELLRAMGEVLRDSLDRGELVAHVSGDSFVMFLHSPSQEELITRIKLLKESIVDLSPLLDVPHVAPLFGIRAVDSPNKPEKCYSDANLAKQKIKERAGFFYAIFDEETRSRAVEVQRLEDNFEIALEGHQFEMWYQPKYVPGTGELASCEALVRWRIPDGTLIPPGKFIPLFEHNGMIAQLDEYTFDMVCQQQRIWLDQGRKVVPVSVNVSRASLYFSDIVGRYMVIVNKHGISTDCIELEVTESAMAGNGNIESLIQQFRSCGFRILVDDFGSGYSSLSTLTKKYFDNIKIDKSLVDCIGAPEGDSLLNSIIHLAHEFHMTVTAEGVEQASQVEFLKGLACDNIQGYFYSRPLPVADFTALLESDSSGKLVV